MYVCCLVLSEIFFLTVPPITKAEEMIIRFLTIYCPSNVSPYGKSVKHTSGSKTNGRNVPGICRNNKNIDILKESYAVKDNQDLLAMTALQFATKSVEEIDSVEHEKLTAAIIQLNEELIIKRPKS